MKELDEMTVDERDELRRRLFNLDTCTHICAHGPGHQTRSVCEVRGRHSEHSALGSSGDFWWTDEQEVEVTMHPWKRDESGKFLADANGHMIPDEPYTEMVYYAPWES